MMAPRYPTLRGASFARRLLHAIRRVWLTHQINAVHIDIGTLERMIDNDNLVVSKFPDMEARLRPVMDACRDELRISLDRMIVLRRRLDRLENAA